MERIFDQASIIKLLKDGLKKPNPKNPKRMMWTLEDLDKPPPGFTAVSYTHLTLPTKLTV